jgi:hypothetical protein
MGRFFMTSEGEPGESPWVRCNPESSIREQARDSGPADAALCGAGDGPATSPLRDNVPKKVIRRLQRIIPRVAK